MSRIHPTAVLDPGAKIGERVVIGPFAVLGGDVVLDDDVDVGPHTVLAGTLRVGCGTRIFPGCVIGTEPQIVGEKSEIGRLEIGRDNVIREQAVIHSGSGRGDGCTRIGDGNYLLNNVHIAHDCEIGSKCVLTSFAALAGHVVLEDHVVLGAMTGVHQFVRIGESAFSAANAMLSKDVPPFVSVAGDRAHFTGLNRVGLARRGLSHEVVAVIKHAYHLLFKSGLRIEHAIERIKSECAGNREVERILAFLERAERGVVR